MSSSVDIINNIAANMAPIQSLATGLAYIIGIGFAMKALMSLKHFGESKAQMSANGSMKEPLIYILVASMFIFFPTGLNVILTTAFGDSNILQYAPISSSNSTINTLFGQESAVGESIVIIIQTIGIIAFIRGWILIARSASHGQQPGVTGKGIMHIFGGILAINIVLTLEIINNTLYGT